MRQFRHRTKSRVSVAVNPTELQRKFGISGTWNTGLRYRLLMFPSSFRRDGNAGNEPKNDTLFTVRVYGTEMWVYGVGILRFRAYYTVRTAWNLGIRHYLSWISVIFIIYAWHYYTFFIWENSLYMLSNGELLLYKTAVLNCQLMNIDTQFY